MVQNLIHDHSSNHANVFYETDQFFQAYTQAAIERNMYMELLQGMETEHGISKDYVLKLLTNLYGQKQAGHVWNK